MCVFNDLIFSGYSRHFLNFLLERIFTGENSISVGQNFFPFFLVFIYISLLVSFLQMTNEFLNSINRYLTLWGLSSILKTPVVKRRGRLLQIVLWPPRVCRGCVPQTHAACNFLSLCAEADVKRSPHWWGLFAGAAGRVWRSAVLSESSAWFLIEQLCRTAHFL